MAEWIVCPNCNLKHSLRPTRVCPRCRLSIDGQGAAAPDGEQALSETQAIGPTPDFQQPSSAPPARSTAAPAAPAAVGCFYHPNVTQGLVICGRCRRRYCPNCVVMLHGSYYCLNCKAERVRDLQSGSTAQRLTVMEAIGMGWQLTTQDFWPLWVVGLVFLAINVGAGLPGVIPYVGGFFQLATAVFLNPPLQAGLVYAVLRRMDGAPADVSNLFECFRQRYWDSIVIMLPVFGLWIVAVALMVGGIFLYSALTGGMHDASRTDQFGAVAIVALIPVALVAIFVAVLVTAMVWFAYVAMWDEQLSGWAAFQAGARVVKENIWPTLGLALMLGLIGLGAAIAGPLALCVGLIITIPFFTVWNVIAYSYIYRSWSRTGASSWR
jgi:hypothetical protein